MSAKKRNKSRAPKPFRLNFDNFTSEQKTLDYFKSVKARTATDRALLRHQYQDRLRLKELKRLWARLKRQESGLRLQLQRSLTPQGKAKTKQELSKVQRKMSRVLTEISKLGNVKTTW